MQIQTRDKTSGAKSWTNPVSASTGANDAAKLPMTGADGKIDTTFIKTSTGAGSVADAGLVVVLGADGKVPEASLPSSVGTDARYYPTSEALLAGNMVDIYDNEGVSTVRKADGTTTGKLADGFVLEAVASGAQALVRSRGVNNQVTGLTIGADVYLSTTTAGAVQCTIPSGAGKVEQALGVALSATAFQFTRGDGSTLPE